MSRAIYPIAFTTEEGGCWIQCGFGESHPRYWRRMIAGAVGAGESPHPVAAHSFKFNNGMIWDSYFKGWRPVCDGAPSFIKKAEAIKNVLELFQAGIYDAAERDRRITEINDEQENRSPAPEIRVGRFACDGGHEYEVWIRPAQR